MERVFFLDCPEQVLKTRFQYNLGVATQIRGFLSPAPLDQGKYRKASLARTASTPELSASLPERSDLAPRHSVVAMSFIEDYVSNIRSRVPDKQQSMFGRPYVLDDVTFERDPEFVEYQSPEAVSQVCCTPLLPSPLTRSATVVRRARQLVQGDQKLLTSILPGQALCSKGNFVLSFLWLIVSAVLRWTPAQTWQTCRRSSRKPSLQKRSSPSHQT